MRGTQSIQSVSLVGMLGVALALAPRCGAGQDLPRVIMQTDLGEVEIERASKRVAAAPLNRFGLRPVIQSRAS